MDLIKREDAIKAIAEYFSDDDDSHWNAIATYIIKDIPSAEKQGEWIISEVEFGYKYQCKDCGWNEYHAYKDVEPHNFCPNCGARMKGADDA